jgi:serine/threonine protein kinase
VKKPTPFGKYYLLERISVGGMAEVFRAKAFGVEGFERLVAVKRILSSIAEDKEFIRMFIEEAKLAVQLNHANIAQIFDLGVVDGSYYIALEHVHGRDLRVLFDRCRQLGEAMAVAQACFLAMKVCEGLDYAHNKRDQAGRELSLVHRDVSPQNILVSFEGEVKLIDFGIAKAAGTNSSQAGVLKGKFGYMSPEQVRGQDVDRRSDVFSCGIVLYELLTGERLFVGDSDFSTLEKVRNVEILPPSTYNRKIPDELERIVLKALSKDADDRYQNAIDLHDELQAFVYTAGEFYSRKDLAAWMKKTFGKEIEEETVKLESYRQLRPPAPMIAPASPPMIAPAGPSDAVPEPVRAAASQPVSAPPLPPARKPTQPVPVTRSAGVKSSQPVPVVKPPPPPVSRSQPVPLVPSIPDKPRRRPVDQGWDDDDVETRVYDGDDPRRANRSNLPLQPPVSSSPGIPLPPADPLFAGVPVVASSAWAREPVPESFSQGSPNPHADLHPGLHGSNGVPVAPAGFPVGSDNLPAPMGSEAGAPDDAMPLRRELSAPHRVVAKTFPAADLPTIPVSRFGERITRGRRPHHTRGMLPIAIGGVALVVVVAVVAIAFSGGKPRPTAQPTPAPDGAKLPPPPPPPDPSTGFDLYVTPSGISQWKLDGETRNDRLPSRIRGIAPGLHSVQIEPPPGFLSQNQQVAVELGKAPKIEIALQPISGITGTFESTPPGATVSLIIDNKRQAIGPSPAKAPLDPRSSYQVLFEKPGYRSVNHPISFSGALEERVVVNLEKVADTDPPAPVEAPPPTPAPHATPPAPHAAPPAHASPAPHAATPPERPRRVIRPERPERPAPEKPDSGDPASPSAPDDSDARSAPEPRSKPQGILVLGSKPPCDIAIDGIATNLHTPQKEIKLAVGKHRVTLTNSEFGINETFTVDIKADAPEKLIKDYSDRLPN